MQREYFQPYESTEVGAVPGVVAFAFVSIAVRTLGTSNYGLFRQVSQVLTIAAQVGLAGFNYSAMRFIASGGRRNRDCPYQLGSHHPNQNARRHPSFWQVSAQTCRCGHCRSCDSRRISSPGGHSTAFELASLGIAGIVYLGLMKWMGIDPEEQYVWLGIKNKARSVLPSRMRG
ncbi:MAG: hypothetical protein QOH48_1734 [Actinomycetota bacterium]|jgi:hypothetical protein|nr:hypothetical protein [Actinomycetota bacterium]